MFDYNRGYSDDLEASGISDIFRIPKFSYYFYQSQKTPGEDEFSRPMVFIASYWMPESTTRIQIFSNTEEVELYLNDRLVERKKPEINTISDELKHPPFIFDLEKFERGELKAIGYINGKEVATYKIRTPGEPHKIELSYDLQNMPIAENTPDVVFVYAKIVDINGTVIPGAENKVAFKIISDENSAKLIGGNPINAEAGTASILLRTETKNSAITIEANSEGIKSDVLKI
jgi:beta-galactosidase